jgi:hypothetical protein
MYFITFIENLSPFSFSQSGKIQRPAREIVSAQRAQPGIGQQRLKSARA